MDAKKKNKKNFEGLYTIFKAQNPTYPTLTLNPSNI
jgi:hypothetical protein